MILVNRAQCSLCGDIIQSNSVHEWVVCDCGACSVDGGTDYLHWSGPLISLVEYDE